jgi:hypothetical protein
MDANTRGAGKGKLADPIALVASGQDFARAAYSRDDEEMRKTVTSVAVAGDRLVLLDNVAETLGTPSLDAALTSTEWQDRILGSNARPRLPLLATWVATGNNVVIGADTARRVCHVRLQSPEERPEERTDFRHPDLLGWVRENRGRLLVAGLTILAAYCRAGRPKQGTKAWGSFEGWSDLVRSAVVWAGLPDPGLARAALAERSDTEAQALKGLIEAWAEVDPSGKGCTAADALKRLAPQWDDEAKAWVTTGPGDYPRLRAVFGELFDLSPGKLPGSKQLGKRLGQFEGRVCGGRCFASRPVNGTKVWSVQSPKATAKGFEGFEGFLQPHPSAYEEYRTDKSGMGTGPDKPLKPLKPLEQPAGREVLLL